MRFVIHRFDEVESTQAIARELAEEGAPEGTVVQASSQSAGRGRIGNSFFSPFGGLYLSVVLRPPLPPEQGGLVGLAAGLGVAEGIQTGSGLQATLKWPNDLLLNGRKVGGLLVDLAMDSGKVRYAILGIGINAYVGREGFPDELRALATSLAAELGHAVLIDDLRESVLECLAARCRTLSTAGPGPVLDAWRAWPNTLGRRVQTAAGDEGVAENLDLDGALLLRLDAGELRRVVAGEVHLVSR